ncbi:MAG: twin-arginine translocase subunit TatC [Endomicrobiia bacterium]|nr:twin-arginine translocase subunit TatC [Endomicrobiaceae bacterium]MDD3053415.1 twin-arginine translocase subunit TatC [Endomicrobiaceae bacterium]MDD3922572.1 twin-arginine translocase subunit TatC [Endomicrobiaceae bacterium]MDD5101568.1 twin-arginine translocase subunit TatC [Endomicrobiaceae bacterium]
MTKQPVLSHLEDLRWLIIRTVIYLLIASCLSFFIVDFIIELAKLPSKGIITNFLILKPTEAITIYFKTIIYSGLVISFFPICYECIKFIAPALQKEQTISIVKYSLSAFSLFILGTVFSYFIVLPNTIKFLINLSVHLTSSVPQFTLNSYISFVFAVLLSGGIIFQIPLTCAILTTLQIVSPNTLKKFRKEVFFALCVFAAIITPTTDVFSLTLFVLPMVILYEVGIFVSNIIYKKTITEDTIYGDTND